MSNGDSAEMDFKMESDNKTFILSLEDIDMNLLPNYFKNIKEKVMPLWSMSNLDSRRGIYYKFQVLDERDDEEDLDENNNMMPCHICDINVPVTYINEHNNSTKHLICARLADHALERIKRQMTEKFELTTKVNNSTYYCDACALAVKIKNKEQHERTKEHLNAKAYDTLLNGLLMIYVDKNTVDEFKIGFNASGDGEEIKAKRDSDNDNSADKLKFAELRKYIDQICSLINPKHSMTAIEKDLIKIKTIVGDKVKVAVDGFHGFYTGGSKVQCRLCRVEVVNERAHKYEKEHVEKVMAPLKDKHCIRELDDINHCVLCNENVDSTHLSSTEHNLNLKNALISDDDSSDEDDGDRDNADNYCKLCDKLLPIGGKPESVIHRSSAEHRLSVWLSESKLHYQMKTTIDPEIVYCTICSVPVLNNDKEINDHLESDEHNTIYKEFLESNQIEKYNEYNSFCQLCSNRMLMIDETNHCASSKHSKNVKRFQQIYSEMTDKSNVNINLLETENEFLLNTDGILNFDLDESSDVSRDEETLAILNQEFENTPNLLNLKATEGNVILILTNTVEDLSDMKETLEAEIKAQRSVIKPAADLTQVYYLMEKTTIPSLLMCKVCRTTVPNTVHDVNYHNKGRIHYQNFMQCIDKGMNLLKDSDRDDEKKEGEDKKKQKGRNKNKKEDKNESGNSKIDNISDISLASCSNSKTNLQTCSDSETILLNLNSETIVQSCSNSETLPSCSNSKKNHLSCSNSETILPSCSNSETNLQSCSNSETSLQSCSNSKVNPQSCFNSETNLQSSNSETYLPHSSNSETSSQSSTFQIAAEANSNKKTEALSVKKNEKSEFILCEVCLITVPNDDRCLKIHYDGVAHKQNSQNNVNHFLLTKTDNPNQLLCHACNTTVPNTSLNTTQHLSGTTHQINYKAMLQKNKLTNIDDTTFFCGYCNVNVAFSHVTDHIRTGFHSLFVKRDINLQFNSKSEPKPQTSAGILTSVPYHYCETCERKVLLYQGNEVEMHEKAKMHLDNLKLRMVKQNKSVTTTQVKPFHFCEICKVKVPNHKYDIGIHEKGKPHLDNMKSRIAQLEKSSTLSKETLKQNYVMELIQTGELHCKVCKVRVSNNTTCVNIHLNGTPHKNAFNNLLKANKMTKVGNRFYCQYCSVFATPSTELKHIEDMKHMLKVCLADSGFVGSDAADSASSSTSGQSLPRRTRSRRVKNNNNSN